MSQSRKDVKGGKRVKKEQRPSRRGIRRTFLVCCVLAIALLAMWQTEMFPFQRGQQGADTSSSSSMSSEPDASAPAAVQPDQSDGSGSQAAEEPVEETPWNLILVNRWHPLPEGYKPQLMTLSNGKQVDERIYPSLQKMFDQARAEGVYPIVASAYRTAEKQQSIMDEKIAEYQANGYSAEKAKTEAEKWVALPGTSEHQLGLAVDINADGINSAGYEVYDWLDKHAHEYGFIRRFPESKTDITGVANEPWHYRYVGKKVAAEIHDRGICLEEYLNQTEHE